MSERYFKSPRVNVRDRAREFEAKQAVEAVAKNVSSSANRRPSSTPKLPASKDVNVTDCEATPTCSSTAASTSTSAVSQESTKNDNKKCLLQVSDNLTNIEKSDETSADKLKQKEDSDEIIKTKVIKREKTVGAKKKVSSAKSKEPSESEIVLQKKKITTSVTAKNNQTVSGEEQPLSKSCDIEDGSSPVVVDPSNGGQAGNMVVVVDTLAAAWDDSFLLDDVKLGGGEEPADVIPAKNTEELVKQFNKLSSAQLELLHKKSCSLDSGLSEITNWVNEEENDTGDDTRAYIGDGKSAAGAKFRKFRNGGHVKNHQQRSATTKTTDNSHKKGNSNQIKNENLGAEVDSGRDMCLVTINKADSNKSGSQVMCKSPYLNQRSTSYLRYLQRITQLQQQRNIESANLQQLVNENCNVYGSSNDDGLKEKEDGISFRDDLRVCNVENVDKDNFKGGGEGIIEDKKQRAKLGRVEINSDGNSSSSQIETKKNLDKCLGGKSANSKSVAATSFSNSLSEVGGGGTSKNSSSSQPNQVVVKRDGTTTSLANPRPITSTLAPKSHYLTSSSSPEAVTVTNISKPDDDDDEKDEFDEDDEDEDAAVESIFRPSMPPSQNKWKTRQHHQQQLISTTLNPVEHRHKQVESNFQPLEADELEVEEEWKIKKKKSVGVVGPGGANCRPGTKDGTDCSSYNAVGFGNWDHHEGNNNNNRSCYSEQPASESSQIAELLTSVRKIREEFERCSLEVEQEVKEAEEDKKKREEKNYASNNVNNVGLVLTDQNTNRQSSKFVVDNFNSPPDDEINISVVDHDDTSLYNERGKRVKKAWNPKNGSSPLSTMCKNSSIGHNQIFGLSSKVANDEDVNGDSATARDSISPSINNFGYHLPNEDYYSQSYANSVINDCVDDELPSYGGVNFNFSRSRNVDETRNHSKCSTVVNEVQSWNNLSCENRCKIASKLVDDGKRMERRNSPGGPATGAARPINDNKTSGRVQVPVSPLNFQRNFSDTGPGNANYTNSATTTNGISSCPNSPRSILTNKSTPTHTPIQQQFNYSNLNNNNNQQQTFFPTKSISQTKSKIQVRSKPELPAYFTFRRRPALRKVSSDPHRYESVSDGEKRELEKIESILGELDFSKYKRGSGYNNCQSNQTSQQQQFPSIQQQHCNYSLVPIRVPRCNVSHQTSNSSSKTHQEKLRELRELTEKLKPTLNKVKLESSASTSSTSSSANSPYPSFCSPYTNNVDGLTTIKSQSLPRHSHLPVFRSASVPQVDDFEDYSAEHDHTNNANNNNCYNLHKSFLSSEYIPDTISQSKAKALSPFQNFNFKSAEQSRLNAVSRFATLPRDLRGYKIDKSDQMDQMDQVDFGHNNDNWEKGEHEQPFQIGDEDPAVVRRLPVDSSTDEGLVADSEAVSDYMQAYHNVTSSFSAPSTPVTRHRVTNLNSTSSNTVDRFDLQVEAAIAELQATTSASNSYGNTASTNLDILHYNSLDRRKRRKGIGLAVGFNTSAGSNEVTAKSGNGRSLTYPPQRRTSVTEGMEYTSMDSNGIPSYIATNSVLNSDINSVSSGLMKSGDTGSATRHRYNLKVVEDVANFPSELSLADSHLCPSEISYEATYSDVLESVTAEPSDVSSGNDGGSNGNGKPLKKKHYSDPSGEKNNEGILLDLPEFIMCAKSEPQLPSNKKTDVMGGYSDERGVLSRSRQSYNSLIPQHHNPAGLTRSASLSPGVGTSDGVDRGSTVTIGNNSVGRNGGGSGVVGGGGSSSSEVTLERSDSKSPQQQRRYSKKRLRGPYGEMLEEEMRKSGEKHSQKVIAEELSFLQELMETRPSPNIVDGVQLVTSVSSPIEPHHSRFHLSSQSLDENALRSNSTVLDMYNQRSVSGGNGCNGGIGGSSGGGANAGDMCYTSSSVPTLLDNRLKDEGPWNLCESLDADGDDVKSLLKRHQDTRTHVVAELYDTEKSYVESLQILVNKYFRPLKSPEYSGLVDAHLVEEMFFQIPEILNHHEVFLEVLKQRLENWDNKQKVGDVFVESFTRQPVIDTYTAFINNWKSAKEAIKIATQAKPAFAKFLEHMSREHKGKLTLDALLIMPVQRIPRYELLIKELLKHTQLDHPDHRLLVTAQKEVHDLAVKINHMEREAYEAEQMQLKLREMESLIEGLIDLVHPLRSFLRYDLVTMSGSLGAKKERCLFLFSDLLIIASIKKKSGPMRKTSTLGSPGSLSYLLEMNKYKLLMKISLDDLDIARSNDTNIKKILKDIEQLEGDVSLLNQINQISGGLACPHQNLDEVVKEMLASVTKLLQERQTSDSQLLCLELTVTTQVGVETMSIIFGAPDKRAFWETAFHEAKQKLALSTDRRPPPEFLYPLPIRKTRAGLQFTCAAPTLGLNVHNMRDVWVCNSDGYVGQVCVLSLQPEPTVTSCNGVCNSRILCIASIPAATPGAENLLIRRRSAYLENRSGISISIEDVDEDEACAGNGNIQLDSDSSEEEKEPSSESQDDESDRRRRGESPFDDSRTEDVDNQSPTMWLGTEDGCIHVYNCNDNIRIKKNKIKLQHPAVIHCIIHMDNKVFVSLANGDVAVYHRDPAGGWNTFEPTTISIGTAAAPVTRMLPVMSKLWCGCHNMVKIVCTTTLEIEHSFPAHVDNNRPIQCMVNSGLGVWTSVQNSSIIKLFHATSFETLLEVNVAPAVSKMLAGCDDIIRQHKTACLRVTSLLACKDLLWIGTSAGVVLNLLLPHLSSTTTKLASIPNVSGIPHGHTGHVRFLTCVEMTSLQEGLRRGKYSHRSTIKYRDGHGVGRRASTSALGSNRLLVISGGDGYEDFRNTNFSEAAGRDDSTNHLLLWQV